MNFWKNVQMVITTVFLLLAAACTLFEEDIKIPYVFSLRLDQPQNAPQEFPEPNSLRNYSGKTDSYISEVIKDKQDSLSDGFDAAESLIEPIQPGEAEIAYSGSSKICPPTNTGNQDLSRTATKPY